jgi:hypothetical protein
LWTDEVENQLRREAERVGAESYSVAVVRVEIERTLWV